ncbi:mitochondrial carrier superfamily protein [Cardiosporidium cionae]|uniref:Mitochondrial carrier superfamily protein n=1 Tax=Cardiosporidium cionae TaxID=476202 RepID=A0ABQ7J6I7_9APIC|nr:mitochondrial carrier superfamily protein [Cardiosporidium cionae]|eukprot:KAF8819594.1 mitochondrial carrier superfamily protein [Cardiosporidium cionae]
MESAVSFQSNHPLISGGISGLASVILLQPLDVIKTRQQQAKTQITSSFHLSRVIVQQEGVLGLYRGLLPSVMRIMPGAACYFYTLSHLQNFYHYVGNHSLNSQASTPKTLSPSLSYNMFASAVARSTACILLFPVTVLKTRMESTWSQRSQQVNGSMLQAIRLMHRNEGLRSFYNGIIPTLVRDVPFSSLYFGIYAQLKKYCNMNDRSDPSYKYYNFMCGSIAGLIASTLTHPPDVVRTRVQLHGTLSHSHLYGVHPDELTVRENGRKPPVSSSAAKHAGVPSVAPSSPSTSRSFASQSCVRTRAPSLSFPYVPSSSVFLRHHLLKAISSADSSKGSHLIAFRNGVLRRRGLLVHTTVRKHPTGIRNACFITEKTFGRCIYSAMPSILSRTQRRVHFALSAIPSHEQSRYGTILQKNPSSHASTCVQRYALYNRRSSLLLSRLAFSTETTYASKIKPPPLIWFARQMVANEGYRVLFKGLGPRVLRRSLTSAVTWTIFDLIDSKMTANT